MSSGERGSKEVLADVTDDLAGRDGYEPTVPPDVLAELELGDTITVNGCDDTYEVTDAIADCPLPVVYLERTGDRTPCQIETQQWRQTGEESAILSVYLIGHRPAESTREGAPVQRISRRRSRR